MRHILAELTPRDPKLDTRPTVRVCDVQDRRVTGLNVQTWYPAITASPALTIRLFDGDFASDIEPGTATLAIALGNVLTANVDRLLWAGAKVTLYAGAAGDSWPWTKVFAGKVDRWEIEGRTLKLTAAVDTEPFEADVLTTYAGTTGIEGDANLKNKVKPWLFGRAMNVEPVLINAVDNVYQFSAYGPIEAVQALYERGASFGAATGDYADYAALIAATIPNGGWGTCLAQGLVRLGAPAYGVITGDVDGHVEDGDWLRMTGEIIQCIAARAGVDAGLIDTSSLDALDTAIATLCPDGGTINLLLYEQTNVLDIARRLARGCNAQAGVSWLGKLFACRVAIGAPAIVLDAQGRRLPLVSSSTEIDVSPPYWRIQMGAERAWRVHSFEEIATYAPLVDRGPWSDTDTYREGNIVQDQDSSWLYINPTPSSGNAPPTLPTGENSWWRIMAAVGARGEPGEPGDPGEPGTPGLNGISAEIDPPAVTVTTASDGTGGDYSGAAGQWKVLYGDQDVTASCTFSEIAENSCTGTINTATDTPVTGAKGSFRVTAASADNASYVMQASYTPPGGSAVNIQKTFTLSKAKTGAPGSSSTILFSDAVQDDIPASGTTETTIYSETPTISSGGIIRITATELLGTLGTGGPGFDSEATLRLKIGGTTVRETDIRIDIDTAEILDGSTGAWSGSIPNIWSGSTAITITRQRSAGSDSTLGFVFSLIVEHVA